MFSSCMTLTGEFAFSKLPVWNKRFTFAHTILIAVSISEPFLFTDSYVYIALYSYYSDVQTVVT